MKIARNIFSIALVLISITSCKKDFLERAPGVNLTIDQVFADPVLAANFGDNTYSYRITDYHRWGASSDRTGTCHLSDEAIAGSDATGSVSAYYTGLYLTVTASPNDITTVWNNSYAGIRNANIMLSRMDAVPWTAAQDPKRIKGEQYFLRAFFYADLLKRFGGVPLITKVYTVTDNIDIPRSSYTDCVTQIMADLTQAEALLPVDYTATSGPNTSANYGRATVGAAMALASRVLLYAASPRDNPSNDLTKWAAAAAAAKAVMDLNRYSLMPTYGNMLSLNNSPEYIQIYVRGPRARVFTYLQDAILSPGSGGDQCSNDPTQNHVDLYEMAATGKPITDATSGYDPTQPYVGRDPRFYSNVIYNDELWEGRHMQMYDGGTDYKAGNIIYSLTRYYNKKYWPEQTYAGSNGTALVNYIYFRYGEILLNYAEAQNEAVGPDNSVYSAVNQIRARAGMPNYPAGLSQAQMRTKLINERAVELAFEDQRWYDIMRLKIGTQVVAAPMKGMNVVKNADGTFTYSVVTIPALYQKVFTDKQNYYPIPLIEVQKSNNILLQNPGWN